jgi:hypothetical protein
MATDLESQVLKALGLTSRDPTKDPTGAHQSFLASRRVSDLILLHGDWATDPALTSLTGRIKNEITAVNGYLTTILGTRQSPGRLGGSKDLDAPAKTIDPTQEYVAQPGFHLDLGDVAFVKDTTDAKKAKANTSKLVEGRRSRIRTIVWRAAAVSPALWQDGDPTGVQAKLVTAKMDVLVNRRLRTVERMVAQVSRRSVLGGEGIPALPGQPTGPWLDHYRIRPFEYPRVGESLPSVVLAINSKFLPPILDILEPGSPAFQPGDKSWLWQAGKHRLHYNVPPFPGLQLRTGGVRENWAGPVTRPPDKEPYELHLEPVAPTTAAQAMDILFQGKLDWWQRTWLFCDHVISAIHVDALLMALRKTGEEQTFNSFQTDFIQLAAHVAHPNLNRLMSGGNNDDFFDNTTISPTDLEVGDHVIFLNSFLHQFMVRDEWRLENALIIDIDSAPYLKNAETDQFRGGLIQDTLVLQGHGIAPTPHRQYENSLIAALKTELTNARNIIVANPGKTAITHPITGASMVRWEPFQTLDNPGAWWIAISTTVDAARWATPADIKKDIRNTIVADDVPAGTAQAWPPDLDLSIKTEVALFPLYEPKIAKTKVPQGKTLWEAYLGGAPLLATTLKPLVPNGTLIPGMFIDGEDKSATPIFVVRPKVS